MELLPEFLFSVVFSLFVAFLFSFVLPVALSLYPSREVDDHVGEQGGLFECKRSQVEVKFCGFVEKDGKVDEFVGGPEEEGFVLQDFADENYGFTTKVDESEVSSGVGVVCLTEKCAEEESFGGCGGVCFSAEEMVDESVSRHEFEGIEVVLTKNEVGILESEDIIRVSDFDGSDQETDGAKDRMEICGEEDDWEGIERTELERLFAAAVAFFGSKSNAARVSGVGSDVKLRLDGLHKIATRGPCFVPQPMAFKLAARAKWNSWQQLGNMSAELAMEEYIKLLSESVPGWMQDVHSNFINARVCEKEFADLKTAVPNQLEAAQERKVELNSVVKGLHETEMKV